MSYRQPTFFGMAYAARLFGEIETSRSLPKLREEVGLHPDICNRQHALEVLCWLNKWGCRITKSRFGVIANRLITWFHQHRDRLPRRNLETLQDRELDALARAYEELLLIEEFGPTAAAKALFVVCPEAAIPWDKAIQDAFGLAGRTGRQYQEMLVRSRDEAEALVADAAHCGFPDAQSIMAAIGSEARTIPELLDQYHWITISRGHRIPDRDELNRWMAWDRRKAMA
ncbi:hypothetical protein [Acidiphilium sp.]|uniref:hypothetical protein n=1 Tax=Acidiphilium sp. TaxID=527 RepID=UPI0025873867|nr:hypothetical protein [Acidiphilium sp.]